MQDYLPTHATQQTPLWVHMITLCFGLIIAFGLHQIVQTFQRHRQRKAREAKNDVPPNPAA